MIPRTHTGAHMVRQEEVLSHSAHATRATHHACVWAAALCAASGQMHPDICAKCRTSSPRLFRNTQPMTRMTKEQCFFSRSSHGPGLHTPNG